MIVGTSEERGDFSYYKRVSEGYVVPLVIFNSKAHLDTLLKSKDDQLLAFVESELCEEKYAHLKMSEAANIFLDFRRVVREKAALEKEVKKGSTARRRRI